MGSIRNADRRNPSPPQWSLWVRTRDSDREVSLNELLAVLGREPVIDWSLRHSRGLPGVESATLTDERGAELWDQFVWSERQGVRGVVVVPWQRREGRVLVGVLTEFRPAVPNGPGVRGRTFKAFPRGFVDKGEGPEEAAVRELREETGLIARDVRDVGLFYGDTAFGSGPVRVLVVESVEGSTSTDRDEHEPIRGFAFVPLAQIRREIMLEDAHSLAALALAEPALSSKGHDDP